MIAERFFHYRRTVWRAAELEEAHAKACGTRLWLDNDAIPDGVDGEAYCWTVLCNDVLGWLEVVKFILVLKLLQDDASDRDKAAFSISQYISDQLRGTLQLAGAGLDVQARQLARSLAEASDVYCLSVMDESFASEFIKSQRPDQTKKLWDKYLSGGKARKRIYNNLGIGDEIVWKREIESVRKDDFISFSAATHPSYLAGIFGMFDVVDDGLNVKVNRTLSDASTRTVRASFMFMIEFILASRAHMQICAGKLPRDFDHDPIYLVFGGFLSLKCAIFLQELLANHNDVETVP